ncbi:MAG: hypothetical protein ACW97X_06095 [Candidatus Hodarchaeales archaeon]|jgi:hypothetical protein
MDNIPNSLKIIFHDFFKEFEQVLKEIITSSIVLSLIGPIIDLTISFSDIENSEEVRSFISNLELPESEINSLNGLFDNPFQTSFSYGHQDKEFVFIQLDKTSPLLHTTHQDGLKGLIIHEILHSIQRQRGLEVRLKNSLVFSLDLFEELASILPPGIFNKEDIINFLKQISQVALLTLKDLYVNVEMIKRNFCSPLTDFLTAELGIEKPDLVIPLKFDSPFQKGKISVTDLNEFAQAFNYTLSLIPAWLPSMVLEVDSKDYTRTRELKQFIFKKYYINPFLITREMWHIENIFLTNFSFSKSFHLKWFGAIFNLALEYILGEDFVFYHLSKSAELIEAIYNSLDIPERKKLAIVPILKAAYVHKKEYPAGIQQRNIDDLESMMGKYSIDTEEISELEESLEEHLEIEGTHFGHFFENLLQVSIMILASDQRKQVMFGNIKSLKRFSRAILTILQTINYLGEFCDDKYYHSVRLTTKRLLRSDNIFKQKKLALFLENITKQAIYRSDIDPTPIEVDELLFNFDFFELPITNVTADLGMSFIQSTKTILNKVSITDPDFPLLTSQFINIILREKQLDQEILDQLNMILVSSLIATTGVPFTLIQSILEYFLGQIGEINGIEKE